MARFSFKDAKVEVDDSGGSPIDMSAFITEVETFDRESITEEVTAVGDADEAHASTGIKRASQFALRGPYDDTAATGPDAIFNSIGDTRTVKFTWGSTKTSTVECIIKNYKRTPTRGGLTQYEVMLQPTGVVTEA